MKQTITLEMFKEEFKAIRPNQFSSEALELIYDFFEEVDPDFELDVIAICCDFTEEPACDIEGDFGSVQDVVDHLNDLTMAWCVDGFNVLYVNY